MRQVAIIGGGATGALTAINLLKRLGSSGQVILCEPSETIGAGIAYGTSDPAHLLNLRATGMSLFPDDMDDYCKWLVSKGYFQREGVETAFSPRVYYREYITEALNAARGQSKAAFRVVRETALGFEREGEGLKLLTTGAPIEADAYVLALGHLPPRVPSGLEAIAGLPRYIGNPWKAGALGVIGADDTVFIVGAGLTMVDQVMTLQRTGHRGRIIARSRRGFLPKVHQVNKPVRFELADLQRPNLFRHVRKLAREAGEDWRSVIDGIRPYTPTLWASLSPQERRRFLRRLVPYWDVHRHRIPPEASDVLENLLNSGQLDPGAGSIRASSWDGNQLQIELSGPAAALSADWVINCTGPDADWRSAKVPLLESAISLGLAEYDELGLGIAVDKDGRTEPTGKLWALGPICKGTRWETIGVPEIRFQAIRVAENLGG